MNSLSSIFLAWAARDLDGRNSGWEIKKNLSDWVIWLIVKVHRVN